MIINSHAVIYNYIQTVYIAIYLINCVMYVISTGINIKIQVSANIFIYSTSE